MKTFADIRSFALFLERGATRVEEAQRAGLAAAGADLVQHAKDMIGTEDASWPPLAESTIAEKSRLGFTGQVSATDPLLRTGGLRDSIAFQVRGSNTVAIGSTDKVAVYQEVGTVHIPPRPFLSSTLFRHGREAVNKVSEHVMHAVAGRPVR